LLALFAVIAGGVLIFLAAPAAAGPVVDPSTLQPPPPNAVCREDGRQVICDTFVDEIVVNEPIVDVELPCGTIYETSHFYGAGMRWYVDGLLVKRLVVADLHGTWSLSPTGAEPTVTISAHWSFWTFLSVPGDLLTASEINHGSVFKATAPRFGVVVQEAGLASDDGHHGLFRGFPDEPEIAARLCDALTA
jgi:hypothetical protein